MWGTPVGPDVIALSKFTNVYPFHDLHQHKSCSVGGVMPVSISSAKAKTTTKPQTTPTHQRQITSDYVIGEINAFIAIRDELLFEAEESKTASKVESLIVANNFVESVLTPAQSPYDVQFLPEPDARRERQRCEQIKRRAADLRNELEVS